MEHIATSSVQPQTDAADLEGIACDRSRESSRASLYAIVGALWIGAVGLFAVSGARASAPGPREAAPAVSGAPHALAALESACNGGDSVACNDLGVSYEHGYSVQPDSQQAAALFERACEGGVADACNNL